MIHPRRFPFDPESPSKQSWDLVVMLLLLYTTFSVPYALAFGGGGANLQVSMLRTIGNVQYGFMPAFFQGLTDTNQRSMWFHVTWYHLLGFSPLLQDQITVQGICDIVIDFIFITDVVLNFLTAYFVRGVYVTSIRLIAYNYLTTWFVLDICGSVPFDKIFTWASSNTVQDESTSSVLKALRMIRILKLVRAVRFLIKLNELEQKDITGTLKGIVSVSFLCEK